MTIYKEFRVGGNNGSPFGFLGPLLVLSLFFIGLFFLFKGMFYILNIIAPILLIIALIIDYTVFKDFFVFLLKLLKENTVLGVLAVALIFFGYPFVSGYLFVKAILRKTLKKKMESMQPKAEKYTEYEEVVDEKEDDFLDLPPLEKTGRKSKENPYDEMFK
jgi:glucan phosphoethanolaminetransferase (alkaline phosphatase superfamily)